MNLDFLLYETRLPAPSFHYIHISAVMVWDF